MLDVVHCIYKYVVDDKIIYIGKTDSSLISRIRCHKKEDKFQPYIRQAKIYYFNTTNSFETSIYEKLLIDKYKPELNVIDKHESQITGISIDPKEWIEWHELDKKEYKKYLSVKKKYEMCSFAYKTHDRVVTKTDCLLQQLFIQCGKFVDSDVDVQCLLQLSNDVTYNNSLKLYGEKAIFWYNQLMEPHEKDMVFKHMWQSGGVCVEGFIHLYEHIYYMSEEPSIEFIYNSASLTLFYRYFNSSHKLSSPISIILPGKINDDGKLIIE